MVLRLDDTDVERNTEASVQSIFEGLRWLGLSWDEEYKQSERLALHREQAEAIFAKGLAYRDFTPAHQGDEDKSSAQGAWLYNPGMRELSREESDRRAAAGEPFALRYRVPRGDDRTLAASPMASTASSPSSPTRSRTSPLAALAMGMPTYHLASCADDADLRISHIIRGQDHLTNTFKHLLIFEGLGVRAAAVCSPSAARRPRRDQAFQAASRARRQRHHLSRCRAFCPRLSSTSSASSAGRPRTIANFCTLDELTTAVHSRGRQPRQCRRQFH